MKTILGLGLTLFLVTMLSIGFYSAQVMADPDLASDLAAAIGVDPAGLNSATFSVDEVAGAVVSGSVGFLSPTEGGTFAMISSGNAQPLAFSSGWVGTPTDFLNVNNGNPSGTGPLGGSAYDIATLSLNLSVPAGANSLSFNFRFMSEEYPDWVGNAYNDFFVCLLNGTNIAFDADANIINVNNNYFDPYLSTAGTVFNATTVLLTSQAPVTGGTTVQLDFIVGDIGDEWLDSAVFLDNFHFSTEVIGGPSTEPTQEYSLTVNVVGSGSVNLNAAGPYENGEVVQLTAVPTAGWTFSGWSGDLSGSTNPTTIVMNGDKTVTAAFTQQTYSLTVNVVGSGSVNRNVAGPYVYGDVVELTAVPDAGWTFSGWSGGLSGSTNPTNIAMNGDKSVTATFTQETYSLTVNVIGSGSVNRNVTGPYVYGDVVELTAVLDAGWTFSGWSGNLSGSANPTSIVMDANKSVTATFTQETYSLTVNVVGSGSVNLDVTGPYVYGDAVELTAVPDVGWIFSGWSSDLSGSANPTSIVIDANKSVTATFTQETYLLTVNVIGSGNVGRNVAGPYFYGDVVQLTAAPDAGWKFSSWNGGLSGSTNPTTIVMNGDKSVTATFTQETFSLTVNVVGSGSVNRNAAGPYVYGTVVELTAVPDAGWTFSGWSGGLSGSTNPTTIVMNGDKSVTATFYIVNDPPYQPQLSITSLTVENSNDLTVTVTGPTPADPDGDAVTYTYRWLVDVGTGEFLDDELAGRSNHTGNVIPAVDTVVGDTWRVEVTPEDEHGAAGPYAVATWQVVSDATKPVAEAGPDQIVNEETLVTFSGSDSWDNMEIVSYTWTFTDVTPRTLTGINPSYSFTELGVYAVTLNVTDAQGNWDTDTILITVKDVTSPIAKAGIDQTVLTDNAVNFNAGSSSDNVGINKYEWDFGDGNTGTGLTATHTYNETGNYLVTLTVEDNAGNRATASCMITVEPPEVAGKEVVREPRSLSSVAQVALVGTAAVAASAVAASSGAVGQALNSAVSGLPIPDWLKEFLQLYGKDAFETVDKTEMAAMEKAPLISKGELAAISISAVIMTVVFCFVETNGLPDFLNVSVLAVVIPSVLLAVLMENVAEVFAEALSARICRVYRKVSLWLYGTGLFIVSGLLIRLPSGAPTITRYQGGEITDKTKCLIILSKLLILLTLALPFAGLYMLGFEILGDAGLLMTLMSVFYYFIPLKPIVGKVVFDYQKVVSLLALVSTGILFFSFALNLLPHIVYLVAGVGSLALAAISLYLLSKSSSEIAKPTANI